MAKKSRSEQSAADIIGGSEDLINIILLRLPVKSLIKFQLVSKQWRSVISNPVFGGDHISIHHNKIESLIPSGIYFYNSFSKKREIYSLAISSWVKSLPCLSFLAREAYLYGGVLGRYQIVQSCNGLLLCRLGDGFHFCVSNPTTKGLRVLPDEPSLGSSSSDAVPALAFNPLKSRDYKVFSIRVVKQLEAKPRRKKEKCICELLAYSSELGVWKGTGCQFKFPTPMKIRHAVFHDGRYVTWISGEGIVQFDILAEKVIVGRETCRDISNVRYIGEWNSGSLRVVEINRLRYHLSIGSIEMGPEELAWFSTHHVHLAYLTTAGYPEILSWKTGRYYGPCDTWYMVQVLAVSNEGKELYLAIPGKVIHYFVKSREAFLLGVLPDYRIDPEDLCFNCVTAFQFVETLAPV